MTGADIVNLVIVKLEEKSAFLSSDSGQGPILSGGDSLDELKPVYDYIDAHIAEAANEVLLTAPLHRLKAVIVSSPDVVTLENGVGRINLPNDFLRLHTLKMVEWERPVHTVVTMSNPLYYHQQNKYTMGNICKPVVTMTDAASPYLKYYSIEHNHNVEEFSYIARYNASAEYTDESAEAIALNCAKKVYEVYGVANMVTAMQEELNSVLTNMQL